MAENKRGRSSFLLPRPPVITAWASVAGKKESQGPLGHCFDKTSQDTFFGQKTWEQAEKAMQEQALSLLLKKAEIQRFDLDLVLSGDLLNQCIGSAFSVRNTGLPHLGLYGACSTMAESLLLASLAIEAGIADRAAAQTSSHFASSERQYRFPLGYGGQRTPTAQWTATASGCCILGAQGDGPYITHVTCGRIVDWGVTDANNGTFVCFAPYDDPQIAVAVVIEKGGSGAALASTAVDIVNSYFSQEEIGAVVIGENTLLK